MSTTSTAYVNGRIYTVDDADSWVAAMLVDNGTITATGSTDEIRSAAPAGTQEIDLGGRMVMPGIHDAHSHLLYSGLKFHYEARLTPMADGDQIVRELTDCCAAHTLPDLGGWIIGGEYHQAAFPEQRPDREFLDRAFPDQPIFLYDYSIHHGLANSKALALAGLDAESEDPPGGRYVRRPGSNELTGELVEQGTWPVQRAIPDYRAEVYRDALAWAVAVCNSVGITSVQEASATRQQLRAFAELDAEDALPMRVAAHLVWREEGVGMASLADLEEIIKRRAELSTTHVNTGFVKVFLDGAPLPPHFTEAGIVDGVVERDKILVPEAELHEALQRFDAQGLQVKIHCAGTGSVRVALDAYAAVREANGVDGPRHEVAHCTYIDDADYARFTELNVTAEMSPAIWHVPEFNAVLGEGYRFATLRKAGIATTVGSDWIITPTPNLFPPLQGMLQRGAESIDLTSALRILTIDGARSVGQAGRQGSLEPGKSADFIVLDRNLFEVPVDEIGQTTVLRTVFEGRTVFEAPIH